MTQQEILHLTDHTCLKQDATSEDILACCKEALRCETASVCIPPRFVTEVMHFLAGRIPVCTVIGFPLGYNTLSAKCLEAKDAIRNGAREIDMVIPVGEVKSNHFDAVAQEIREMRAVCESVTLKVIIETCLLTEAEKKELCLLVAREKADFIKTSTGFASAGATLEDITLFHSTCPELKIKAAGGIRSFDFAEQLIRAGADRIGASALCALYR